MKKPAILFFILILFSMSLKAQQYSKALGIRGGLSSGFEYRFYTDDLNSYKILLSTRDRGTQLTVLKEFHRYEFAEFSDQLVLIFGVGVHAGFERWNQKHYDGNYTWYDTKTSAVTGIDGLAALEYVFSELPVSIGVEVKPFIDVWGRKKFDVRPYDFAFTLKYLF